MYIIAKYHIRYKDNTVISNMSNCRKRFNTLKVMFYIYINFKLKGNVTPLFEIAPMKNFIQTHSLYTYK